MSGGTTMAIYHFGIIKALYDQSLLPRIICGSSAGSIAAAFLCTRKYEDIGELLKEGYISFDLMKPKAHFVRDYWKN